MSIRPALLLSALVLASACTDDPPVLPEAPPGVEEAIALGIPTDGLVAYRAGTDAFEVRDLDGALRAHLDGDFRAVIQQGADLVLIEQAPGADAPRAVVLDEALQVRRIVERVPPGRYHPAVIGYLVEQGDTVVRLDDDFRPAGAPIPVAGGLFGSDSRNVSVVVDDGLERALVRHDPSGAVIGRLALGTARVEALQWVSGSYLLVTTDGVKRRAQRVLGDQLSPEQPLPAEGEVTVFATLGGAVVMITRPSGQLDLVRFDEQGDAVDSWTPLGSGLVPLTRATVATVDGGLLLTAALHRWDVRTDEHRVTIRATKLGPGGTVSPALDVARSRW